MGVDGTTGQPGGTPPGGTPPGSTPPGSTPPGSTPPGSTPPGTPPGGETGFEDYFPTGGEQPDAPEVQEESRRQGALNILRTIRGNMVGNVLRESGDQSNVRKKLDQLMQEGSDDADQQLTRNLGTQRTSDQFAQGARNRYIQLLSTGDRGPGRPDAEGNRPNTPATQKGSSAGAEQADNQAKKTALVRQEMVRRQTRGLRSLRSAQNQPQHANTRLNRSQTRQLTGLLQKRAQLQARQRARQQGLDKPGEQTPEQLSEELAAERQEFLEQNPELEGLLNDAETELDSKEEAEEEGALGEEGDGPDDLAPDRMVQRTGSESEGDEGSGTDTGPDTENPTTLPNQQPVPLCQTMGDRMTLVNHTGSEDPEMEALLLAAHRGLNVMAGGASIAACGGASDQAVQWVMSRYCRDQSSDQDSGFGCADPEGAAAEEGISAEPVNGYPDTFTVRRGNNVHVYRGDQIRSLRTEQVGECGEGMVTLSEGVEVHTRGLDAVYEYITLRRTCMLRDRVMPLGDRRWLPGHYTAAAVDRPMTT